MDLAVRPKAASGRTGHPVRDEVDVDVRRLPRQPMTDAAYNPERPGGVQLHELVDEAARDEAILVAPQDQRRGIDAHQLRADRSFVDGQGRENRGGGLDGAVDPPRDAVAL